MNNSPSGFWGGLIGLGSTAANVFGAIGQSNATKANANATAAAAAASQAQSKTMLTIAVVGGGVLLLIGIIFAFRN